MNSSILTPNQQSTDYWLRIAAATVVLFVLGCEAPETSRLCTESKLGSLERACPKVETGINAFTWTFSCLDGETATPFRNCKTEAVVLVFITPDCPLANAYLPCLDNIYRDYHDRKIQFFLIHPDPEISHSLAQSHAKEYDISIPVVLDPDQSIAKRAGARVTPEVVVLTAKQYAPIYRGAIDNLYADYGKKRRQATQHYLRDVLDAVLSETPVRNAQNEPVGCFISFKDE